MTALDDAYAALVSAATGDLRDDLDRHWQGRVGVRDHLDSVEQEIAWLLDSLPQFGGATPQFRAALREYVVALGRRYRMASTVLAGLIADIDAIDGPPDEEPPPPPEGETWIIPPGGSIQDILGADLWSSSGKNRTRRCAPGDVIQLQAGEYPHFRITHTEHPDDAPIIIRGAGEGQTFITPNPVGGSHTLYAEFCQFHQLEDLTLMGDDAAALQTENPWSDRWIGNQNQPVVRDLFLRRVGISGGWDFRHGLSQESPRTKQGVQSYGLGLARDGEYGFRWEGGTLRGVFEEHFFYLHSLRGNVLLDGLTAYGAGRTFAQVASRINEGAPPSTGRLHIRGCDISDVCLGPSGGGSAITSHGRWEGELLIEHTTVRLGCDETLHADYQDNITGCVVAHAKAEHSSTGQPEPTDRVTMLGSTFEVGSHYVGKGSARRPNVAIDHVRELVIKGCNIISHDGAREALVIGPNVGNVIWENNTTKGEIVNHSSHSLE